jgi:hypothetical protein
MPSLSLFHLSSCAGFGFRRSALVDGLFVGIWGFFSLSIPSLSVGQAEYIKEFDKNHGPT